MRLRLSERIISFFQIPKPYRTVRPTMADPPLAARRYDAILFGCTGFTGSLALEYILQARPTIRTREHPHDSNTGRSRSPKFGLCGRSRGKVEATLKRCVKKAGARLGQPDTAVIRPAEDIFEAQLGPFAGVDGSHKAENLEALRSVVRQTKLVLTTAGPFARHGLDLARICAETGTHYLDITGETDYVRETIDLLDDTAQKTGAKLISQCGNDCVPWDISFWALCRAAALPDDSGSSGSSGTVSSGTKSTGLGLRSVRYFAEMRMAPSGGTLETAMMEMSGKKERYASKLGFDPLLKAGRSRAGPDGASATAKSAYRMKVPKPPAGGKQVPISQDFVAYRARKKSANFKTGGVELVQGPWIMGPMMASCVRRSNAIMSGVHGHASSRVLATPSTCSGNGEAQSRVPQVHGSKTLEFYDVKVSRKRPSSLLPSPPSGGFGGWSMATGMALGIYGGERGKRLAHKWNLIPPPGSGPTQEEMERGFLNLVCFAEEETGSPNTRGRRWVSEIRFPVDPGYRDTARMLVETGMAVLDGMADGSGAAIGGGCLTPGVACGDRCLERLIATGCEWSIEELPGGEEPRPPVKQLKAKL